MGGLKGWSEKGRGGEVKGGEVSQGIGEVE